MPDVALRSESLDSPVVRSLIASLDAELSKRYPENGATHFCLDADEVAPGCGAFLVAYVAGTPAGCGAVRRIEAGDAELKRMYVVPEMRGRGIGRAILMALEQQAVALGATRVVLETGARQAEALAIYQRAGFSRVEPFGEYIGCALSICMAKALKAALP